MSIDKVSHIGIAVKSIDDRIKFYQDSLGLKSTKTEVVEEQKVKVAFLELENMRLELVEPTSKESSIAKFIDKRGEGIHHIAFEVRDIEEVFLNMRKAGIRILGDSVSKGAHSSKVFFTHPKDTGGILMEFVEEVENG